MPEVPLQVAVQRVNVIRLLGVHPAIGEQDVNE